MTTSEQPTSCECEALGRPVRFDPNVVDFDICRHPRNLDRLTHGWRWYYIEDGQLMSPYVGKSPLPRDGILDDAYFIPTAEMTYSLIMTRSVYQSDNINDIAVTYGRVNGPFEFDHEMWTTGSMRAARYYAVAIATNRADDVQPQYDLPIINRVDNQHWLQKLERVGPSWERWWWSREAFAEGGPLRPPGWYDTP